MPTTRNMYVAPNTGTFVNTAGLQEGDTYFVDTLLAEFEWIPGTAGFSGLTVDGITIVQGNGGVWVRVDAPHTVWQHQSSWYIDPVNGHDQSMGNTPSAALQTCAEYNRRTGRSSAMRPVFGNVTVNIVNSPPATDPLIYAANFPSSASSLVIQGTGATVQKSSRLSSFTQYNPTTNTPTTITDTTVSSFSSFVGMQLVMTSGAANGARANIIAAPSANTARLDWLTTINASSVLSTNFPTPAAGDSYQIVSLVQVPTFAVDRPLGWVSNDTYVQAATQFINFTGLVPSIPWPLVCYYCQFSGASGGVILQGENGGGSLIGCLGNGVGVSCGTGDGYMGSSSVLNGFVDVVPCSWLWCEGVILEASTALINESAGLEIHNLGLGVGCFDCATPFSFQQAEAGTLNMEGPLWGSNNTGCIINIETASRVVLSSSYTSLLNASGGGSGYSDVIIRGQTSLPRWNNSALSWSTPAVATSFANFKAAFANGGFGGQMFDPNAPATGMFAQV